MNLIQVRRISQTFFLVLFVWFCLVNTLGEAWWQLRGWPVNWFLELDPLLALATLLATGTLYAGLLWALLTMGLTLILGRFFCGWVCPLGTLHQMTGWLGLKGKKTPEKIKANLPGKGQKVKYYILLFLLAAACGDLGGRLAAGAWQGPFWALALALAGGAALIGLIVWELAAGKPRRLLAGGVVVAAWLVLAHILAAGQLASLTLQTGLLDPLSLLHRTMNLVLLPLLEPGGLGFSKATRWFLGGWFILAVFAAALALNLKTPRFYCRYVCPLGALFGLLGRFAPLRIAKMEPDCSDCRLCEAHCQGACAPPDKIHSQECLLCLHCRQICPDKVMTYGPKPSAAGHSAGPDLSRRGVVWSLFSGVVLAPALRLGGRAGGRRPGPLRPPGSLAEPGFLARCTKCGQCMRVCPTGIIQPAAWEAGLEGLWTPVLNFRLGSGGCLVNCIACGNLCPTAAIRPLSLDERRGKGAFSTQGPVRLGSAFVDRGRCLPWAMDRPCIVCQEMCPVSPKAIFTRPEFRDLRLGRLQLKEIKGDTLVFSGVKVAPGSLAGGDHFVLIQAPGFSSRRRILSNGAGNVRLEKDGREWPKAPSSEIIIKVQVRLLLPFVDPQACVGCGACEHACPVSVIPAIRVTAENQTRGGARMLAGP
ncbi:MAG: 4Fe-4S binding protein [Desulfarculaceae bacterium]|jgi:polyferredoxin/formate hydrogenlyase subunit 6/NADH:ubiquinone oxidoreductase subunit I